MKRNLKALVLGLGVSVALTTTGNAITYNWVPDNTLTLQPTSGVLEYSGGVLTSFSFSYDGYANSVATFVGNIIVLGNGNLDLDGPGIGGTSSGPGAPTITWYTFDVLAENYGNVHADGVHPAGPIFGSWVPAVPDGGSTLLLLGAAMAGLGSLRWRRTR